MRMDVLPCPAPPRLSGVECEGVIGILGHSGPFPGSAWSVWLQTVASHFSLLKADSRCWHCYQGQLDVFVFRWFRQRSGWVCIAGVWKRGRICGAHCSFFGQDAGAQVDTELEEPHGSLVPFSDASILCPFTPSAHPEMDLYLSHLLSCLHLASGHLA